MPPILGIDHVAITVADLEVSFAFYRDLLGARIVAEHAPQGPVLVRQVALGGAQISIHQAGNGVALVARAPTPGAADLCLRWGGAIADAMALLRSRGIPILDGPTPRRTADGRPARSLFFRDPDGNLLELMAAEPG